MKINYNWDSKAYNDFITYLEKISDEKTKAFNSKIINTKYEILGIKTPILKLIAKDISKTNIFFIFNVLIY